MRPPRVLIVDDERSWRTIYKDTFEDHGYECRAVGSGPEALVECRQFRPDVALIDILMDGMDGITLLKEMKKELTDSIIPCILTTALSAPKALLATVEAGMGSPIILKRDGLPEVLAAIKKSLAAAAN